MKSDIDQLMEERGIDVLFVFGDPEANASVKYFVGGGQFTHCYIVKKRGEPPTLFHASMERGEAERTGMPHVSFDEIGALEIMRKEKDRHRARVEIHRRMFEQAGARGRIAACGRVEISRSLPILRAIEQFDGMELVSETGETLLDLARNTKDEDEVAIIRDVGARSCKVFEKVVGVLRRSKATDGKLAYDGQALTVGWLKRYVRREMFELGLIEGMEMILSTGSQIGVPHNPGDPDQYLMYGKPIMFDFFPRDIRSSYFFDMTRTYVVGQPSGRVNELYAQVLEIIRKCTTSIRVGMPARELNDMVVDYFVSHDHPTIWRDQQTTSGYIHGLGHGLGLEIHEKPGLSSAAASKDVIEAGSVFTLEPGLYYPDEEIAVRLEDVVYVRPDGNVENLTTMPYDMVIEPQG